MSQSWFISKKKVYVIYYVIKPLLDVIIRPYDVYKCIKMSKVGSFPKKVYLIYHVTMSKNAFKCPTGSNPKKVYVIYNVIKLLSDVIIRP